MDSQSEDKTKAISYVRELKWPLVVAVFLFLFYQPITDKFKNAKQVDVKVQTKIFTIAANLVAAEASFGSSAGTNSNKPINLEDILATARSAESTKLDGSKVLWVDDNPGNNVYERQALSALGIEFVLAKDTASAMSEFKDQKFQVVISDFKRVDDPNGGYTLLDKIKRLPSPPPYIIYSGSVTPQYQADAIRRGALGETNSPKVLFDLVVEAIKRK